MVKIKATPVQRRITPTQTRAPTAAVKAENGIPFRNVTLSATAKLVRHVAHEEYGHGVVRFRKGAMRAYKQASEEFLEAVFKRAREQRNHRNGRKLELRDWRRAVELELEKSLHVRLPWDAVNDPAKVLSHEERHQLLMQETASMRNLYKGRI